MKNLKKYLWRTASKFIKKYNLDKKAAERGWFSPKVIVRMDGGLASQISFFSLGYIAAKKAGLPLYLDITWFQQCSKDLQGKHNRIFNLFNAFPAIREKYSDALITDAEIPSLFLKLFSDSHNKRDITSYDPNLYTDHSVYLDCYYPSVQYIAQEQKSLKELFQFGEELSETEQELLHSIESSNSCALHIRRGDYCGTVHEVCTENYYKRAIARMSELHPDIVFYVFSNDEEWVEQFITSLPGAHNFVILRNRSEATPIVDMHLMSACKHAIISNSGFSFFPAFLTYSEQKTVIMPEVWLNGSSREKSRYLYYMPGWIQLEID